MKKRKPSYRLWSVDNEGNKCYIGRFYLPFGKATKELVRQLDLMYTDYLLHALEQERSYEIYSENEKIANVWYLSAHPVIDCYGVGRFCLEEEIPRCRRR